MSARDVLVTWLRDALAMETAMLPILQRRAQAAKDQPEMRRGLDEHLRQTQRHADQIREWLQQLGAAATDAPSPPAGPFDWTCRAALDRSGDGAACDGLLRDALADCTAQFLLATTYEALVAAAQHAEEPEIGAACVAMRDDAQRTAHWLHDHFGTIVENYVQRAAGVPLRR